MARRPTSVTEARGLLVEADPETREGRAQIEVLRQWAEGRTDVPEDLARDLATKTAIAAEASTAVSDAIERGPLGHEPGFPSVPAPQVPLGLPPAFGGTGRATPGVANFSPRAMLDRLSVVLGVFHELDTEGGQRFLRILREAGTGGDPEAVRELERLLEDEGLTDAARRDVVRALNDVTFSALQQDSQLPPPAPGELPGTQAQGMDEEQSAQWQSHYDFAINQLGESEAGARRYADVQMAIGGQGAADEDPFVGLPEGVTSVAGNDAIYRESQLNDPYGWEPTQVVAMQRALAAAGLLREGTFRLGEYRGATRDAYAEALAIANHQGTEVTAALDNVAQGRLETFRQLPTAQSGVGRQIRNQARQFLMQMGRSPSQITDADIERVTRAGMGAIAEQQRQLGEQQVGDEFVPQGQVDDGPFGAVGMNLSEEFSLALQDRFARPIAERDRAIQGEQARRDVTASIRAASSQLRQGDGLPSVPWQQGMG